MKKLILTTTASMAFSFAVFAQGSPKYMQAMGTNLAAYGAAKSPEEVQKVMNTFERIAQAEPKEWLPYYYMALNKITSAFNNKSSKEIDELIDKAEPLVDKADAISPNNSEILLLKAMCASARLMADPAGRAMTKSVEAAQFAGMAKGVDPNNPRIYLFQAQSAFYTPKEFGGGKDVAKPLVEKAVALFSTFKPSSQLMPTWGADQAEALLKQCQ